MKKFIALVVLTLTIPLQGREALNKPPRKLRTDFLTLLANPGTTQDDALAAMKSITFPGSPFQNALMIAAAANNIPVCTQLLNAGADIHGLSSDEKLTALHYAARSNLPDMCRFLIGAGAGVDVQESTTGKTPLYMAAEKFNTEACVALLQAGADVNISATDGTTPLSKFFGGQHEELCKMFLNNGATVYTGTDLGKFDPGKTRMPADFFPKNTTSNSINKAISIFNYAYQAAGLDSSQGVPGPLNATDTIGNTPLHFHALLPEYPRNININLLIAGGGNIFAKNNAGDIPALRKDTTIPPTPILDVTRQLFTAVKANDTATVKILFTQTALASAITSATDNRGRMPIHYATSLDMINLLAPTITIFDVASKNDATLVQNFINLFPLVVKARASENVTPLHSAAQANAYDACKILLNAGASLTERATSRSTTPLGLTKPGSPTFHVLRNTELLLGNLANLQGVSRAFSPQNIQSLISQGAAVNARTYNNDVLVYDSTTGKPVTINVPPTAPNGYTALHFAAFADRTDLCKVLLDNGAQITTTMLNEIMMFGDNATKSFLRAVFISLSIPQKTFRYSMNAINDLGETTLHIAARTDNLTACNYFLQNGASVFVRDNSGFMPLHRAAQGGFSEIGKALIAAHANPSIASSEGLSPLHYAAKKGSKSTCIALLNAGANVFAEDGSNNLPTSADSSINLIFQHARALITNIINGRIATAEQVALNIDAEVVPNATDTLGNSALYYAASKGLADVCTSLLKAGASTTSKNFAGLSPLDVQKDNVLSKILWFNSVHESITNNSASYAALFALMNRQFPVDITDTQGRTALYYIVRDGNDTLFKQFVNDCNTNVDSKCTDGTTPLIIAIQSNKVDICASLIRNFLADPTIADNNEDTPLHWAARMGNVDICKILLDMTVSTTAKNKDDQTPIDVQKDNVLTNIISPVVDLAPPPVADTTSTLLRAVSQNDTTLCQTLLRAGANVSTVGSSDGTTITWSVTPKDSQLTTILSNTIQLLYNAQNNSLTSESCTDFITAGAVVQATDNYGNIALLWAAVFGNTEVCSKLIDAGSYINAQDVYNMTALMFAVYYNHINLYQTLLQAGANVNTVGSTSDGTTITWNVTPQNGQWNVTPQDDHMKTILTNTIQLLYNAQNNSLTLTSCADFITAGAIVQATDASGNTSLHWAAAHGKADVCSKLVTAGANINAKNNSDQTPLDVAATIEIQTILQPPPVTFLPTLAKQWFKTIADAISGSDDNLPFQFLQAHSDFPVNTRNNQGETALYLAAQAGSDAICKALIQEFKANVNTTTTDGLTPLLAAIQSEKPSTCELLLTLKANPNFAGPNAETPLHWAAWTGNDEICKALMNMGANIFAKDITGSYPSDVIPAIQRTRLLLGTLNKSINRPLGDKSLLALLDLDASPNATDQNGRTSLYYAAYRGNAVICTALLKKGANVNAKDPKGKTPLDYTANTNPAYTILINAGAKLGSQV